MIKKVLMYLPAVLFLFPSVLPEKKLTILPAKGEKCFRLQPYVDYLDTTRGSLGKFTSMTDSLIVFEYTLRMVNNTETVKPISGFTLMFDKNSRGKFLDVRPYDFLTIAANLKEATSFTLYLKTFEHFTDTTKWMTQRYSEKEVVLQPRINEYRLKFKEFATPNWWKSLIGPRFLSLPKVADYSKVMALDFQNTPGGQLDVPERLEIRKIEFSKDRSMAAGVSMAGFFIWIAAVSLFLYIRSRLKRTAVKPVKHVNLANQSQEQLDRLVAFIGSHYQVPDLSVDTVSKETGIGLPRISTLLQQKYGVNFKQYLNDLRIGEAQRLLKESDRTIAEIAFAVGYNSIPHFNRVFRQHANSTPTEFRDTGKKS